MPRKKTLLTFKPPSRAAGTQASCHLSSSKEPRREGSYHIIAYHIVSYHIIPASFFGGESCGIPRVSHTTSDRRDNLPARMVVYAGGRAKTWAGRPRPQCVWLKRRGLGVCVRSLLLLSWVPALARVTDLLIRSMEKIKKILGMMNLYENPSKEKKTFHHVAASLHGHSPKDTTRISCRITLLLVLFLGETICNMGTPQHSNTATTQTT